MEKILIGKITSPVGLKGEVKVYNYSDSIGIYEETEALYVGDELHEIQRVRQQKNMVVLKLAGIDTREDAEAVRGRELFVTEDDLPELPEGEFYVRELIGMQVMEENGDHVGEVTDVIQNTAQDLLQVKTDEGKSVLIPKVDVFVLDIDKAAGTITVRLQEGLMDL